MSSPHSLGLAFMMTNGNSRMMVNTIFIDYFCHWLRLAPVIEKNWETWDSESLQCLLMFLFFFFFAVVKWLTTTSGFWRKYGDITSYDWQIMLGGWYVMTGGWLVEGLLAYPVYLGDYQNPLRDASLVHLGLIGFKIVVSQISMKRRWETGKWW